MGIKKSKANYLDLIPKHSDGISYEENDLGKVTLYIENRGVFNALMQKIAKKPRITGVLLEGQGSFVWQCIDGKKTVYDIAGAVKDEFGKEAEPVYSRLIPYMRTLEQCGFIEMKRQSV